MCEKMQKSYPQLRGLPVLWISREVWSNRGYFCQEYGKLPETKATEKLDAETVSSWSYDMEGHAKKCVERYCELANKTTQQLCKVSNSMP